LDFAPAAADALVAAVVVGAGAGLTDAMMPNSSS
jgi:hypothetical protein